jgi:hypothetical protein
MRDLTDPRRREQGQRDQRSHGVRLGRFDHAEEATLGRDDSGEQRACHGGAMAQAGLRQQEGPGGAPQGDLIRVPHRDLDEEVPHGLHGRAGAASRHLGEH